MPETRTTALIRRLLAFTILFLLSATGPAQHDYHSDESHETHDESVGDGDMHHDGMQHDGMSDDGMQHDGMNHDGMHHEEMGDDGMGMDHDAHGETMPSDLDLSTLRNSENGHFVISYVTSPESPRLNQMHTWTLHIENAHGHPVEDAEVMVSGDMPQHGHGLPTEPRVTQNLGNGDYLVEGMRFQMPGWWVVEFMVDAGGMTDSVSFNLMTE